MSPGPEARMEAKDALPPPPALTGRKRWGWVPGILLLAGFLIFVLARYAEEQELARLFLQARPGWLLAAAGLQACTYLCAAALWKRVLLRTGVHAPVLALARLSLMKLSFDQIFPSAGLGGSLVVARGLRRQGASPGAAAASVLITNLCLYISQALTLGGSVLFLWARHQLIPLVTWLAGTFSILFAIVPVTILWLTRHQGWAPPRWSRRVPGLERLLSAISQVPPGLVRNPPLLFESTLLYLSIFLLDAATLGAALRALGHTAPLSTVLVSFMLASVAETVGIIPGGVGTFEAACVGLLNLLGVPLETALAGTLLLRGFTLWLPLPAGLYLLKWSTSEEKPDG
ncbi:lysylphosphatidylglycerol synthase transmembrane domain-containing protein [Hyalangium versicolor]|uniref:lysylphosphatidylglycerol synthase transmembrane domain-containing protein n=1 Tax=Hyalangium versicolor TaxID=2861190 RepID=UPI001CCE3071|nr:lysylphosphatidylglycerol synthase transmembrane domain-containing protein [Hyalangium versicolor]